MLAVRRQGVYTENMARQLRIEYPGAIYHVTVRGNARQDIFADTHDRERFLRRLSESVETYGVRLYLFCLMPNHVHLVLETPSANLSRFMQSLETGYTVYYNLRHGTVGHLFQGRYKAKPVEGDAYLLRLSRYVHLNPVKTERPDRLSLQQRAARLRRYPWSSYRSYIGAEEELDFVTYGPVLAMEGEGTRRKHRYRNYVEAGLAKDDDEFLAVLNASSEAIGGEAFRVQVKAVCAGLQGKAARPEDVSFRQEVPSVDSEQVLETTCRHLGVCQADLLVKRRNSMLRPIAAMMLAKYAHVTNRQVADLLGMNSGVSASQQVQRATLLKQSNRKASSLMERIAKTLEKIAALPADG